MLISQAWRSWRSAKAVALFAAAALAVGIGSATAVYTVVNTVMLKPLPYRDGDRFVALFSATFKDLEHRGSLSNKDAETFQQRNRTLDAFGWWRVAGKNLTFAGQPHHIEGVAVTTPLVHQFGVQPFIGQWFNDDNSVVISKRLWQQLGSDPGIVGKTVTLDGRSYVITGVMPEAFQFPVPGITSVGRVDVWMPLDPREGAGGAYIVYARRKPDVPFAAAEADAKRVAAEIAAEDPGNHPDFTVQMFDLRATVIKDIRPTLLLLFAAAGLLFLITCANAAGLLLARSVERARDTAIRVALGVRLRQLAAHYFAEGLLVALAGAIGGVLLSLALTPAIVSMAADYLPRGDEVAVDWTVLLFAFVAAIIACALSALAPLWQAARTAPADVLGEGVRASARTQSRRVSQSLVVAEIALAFGLLAVSATLIIHLRNLSRTTPGLVPDNVLTFVLSIPGPIARSVEKRVALQTRLIESLKAIPGTEEVGLSNQLPLKGCCYEAGRPYPDGRPRGENESLRTSIMEVSPGYFRAMKIPLRRGRTFTDSDVVKDVLWVVLDETAAKHYWGDQDPVGTYGRFGDPNKGDRFQVIGVVGDVKNDGLANPTVPEIYIQSYVAPIESMNVVVRSPRAVESLFADIRRVIAGIDKEQPIHEVATMNEIIAQTMTLERVESFMTTFFAAAALLLAMLGIYGVVSYSVRQRTVEIGTRIALGAGSGSVLSLIVGSGFKMAAYGVVTGGIVAAGAAFYLSRVLDLGPLAAQPFIYSTMVVGTISFAASALPAWRASRLSPMVAIRNQSESIWQAARQTVRRGIEALSTEAERPGVPLGTLIGEFAGSIRRAKSFHGAAKVALATLQQRVGAQSIMLLEKKSGGEYQSESCSLPAQSVLVNRLRHYPHPMTLMPSDFETWLRWATEFKPEHVREIEGLRNTGARLAVPLQSKNEIVGVLLLGPPTGRESYTASEKQTLSAAAEVFTLMIENARLNDRALEQEKLRRDVALAAEVQKRLLPPEPPMSAIATFAAFSLPARTVGGDYYDFLDLSGGRIGIAVADVSGKGIPAALLMSVVQASLRAISTEAEISLPQLATKMNGFLYRSSGTNKYATFFYAQFEESNRRLRYINAGHNPPYLVRRTVAGPEIIELSASGTVLGLFPEVQYEECDIELRRGDFLVAFTDGLTEALNADGEEFGEARLKELLRNVSGTADEVSSKLAVAVRKWMGEAEQHDDLTLVVVAMN
jgi:putative ABC transport system permease protein